MRVEQEKKTGNVESVTLEQVPMEERKSWADVAMIQAGIMICVPSLMLGGILAESMPMSQAIWSGVIGYAVIVALMIFCGIMGSDLGVPTCVVASGVFGKQGSSKLISALFMISMIGWFAVQNGVCGSAFSNLIEASTGMAILFSLSRALIPYTAVTSMIIPHTTVDTGTGNLSMTIEDPAMSFADGVVLTISFMATGALNAPDFTRYQRTRKDTVLSSAIGVMPAGMAMLILGAVMTRIAQQYDISLVFSNIGLPFLGMVVLILATWTKNTTNAYSAGLNAVMVFNLKESGRSMATVILGAVGTVLAAVGVAGNFEGFLTLLGNAFMPIIALFIVEYWSLGKGKAENFTLREGWSVAGIVTWALGFAATFLTVGISFINGMLVSGILYLVWRLVKKGDK